MTDSVSSFSYMGFFTLIFFFFCCSRFFILLTTKYSLIHSDGNGLFNVRDISKLILNLAIEEDDLSNIFVRKSRIFHTLEVTVS